MDGLTFLEKCLGAICFMAAFATLIYGLHLIDRGCEFVVSKLFTRKDS